MTMPPKGKAKRAGAAGAVDSDASSVDSDASDKDEDVEWADHPARKVLKQAFFDKEIPLDYKGQPRTIYDKFKDHIAFKGMPYDGKFTGRLRSLRNQVKGRMTRVETDQLAYDNFRRNHPVQQYSDAGQLRWAGSEAEFFLKQDMKAKLHEGVKPEEFWATREEYQLFDKKRFRKHIEQEKRLWKMNNYLEHVAEGKTKKRAKRAAKRKRDGGKKKAKLTTAVNAVNEKSDNSSDNSSSDNSTSTSGGEDESN
jgi:hypothetical protein